MSFHSPIDDVQWNQAKIIYARMRSNAKMLDEKYPPQTADEKDILHSYKRYVRAYGKELLRPHRAIDVDRLNSLQ